MSEKQKKIRRQRNLMLWKAAWNLNEIERKAQTEGRRRRKKFKFCLNVSAPADRQLSALFSELTDQSQLTTYIRNGVALYSSLKDGESLDVLFSMFGWVREVIIPQTDAMLSLSSQLKLLERMMEQSGHTQIPFDKQLMRLDTFPDFDTEELRLATKEVDSSNDSVANFLHAFGEV